MARVFYNPINIAGGATFNSVANFGSTLALQSNNVTGAYNISGTSVSVTGSVTAPILYSTGTQNWGGGPPASSPNGWFARFASDGSIVKTNTNNISAVEGLLSLTNGGTGATTGAVALNPGASYGSVGYATITAATSGTVPFIVSGTTSQGVNLINAYDTSVASGAIVFSVSNIGGVTANSISAGNATYSGLAYSTAESVQLKTASFTVGATEKNFNVTGAASVTVTLPSAASFPGREINIVNKAAFTIISASSNVMPRTGTQTAGTAICAATIGSWAKLVSNGTNWYIMAGA